MGIFLRVHIIQSEPWEESDAERLPEWRLCAGNLSALPRNDSGACFGLLIFARIWVGLATGFGGMRVTEPTPFPVPACSQTSFSFDSWISQTLPGGFR